MYNTAHTQGRIFTEAKLKELKEMLRNSPEFMNPQR